MVGMRKFGNRWAGRIFAVLLAYLLAAEGLVASVGFGMSAELATQPQFSICNSITDYGVVTPPSNTDPNRSGHQSRCPFCFVAAQSAGHLITIGDPPASLAFAELRITGSYYGKYNSEISLPGLLRTTGDPRGPPQFSV